MAKGKYKRKRMIREKQEKISINDLNLSSDVVEFLNSLQVYNVYELLRTDTVRVLEKEVISKSEWENILDSVKNDSRMWIE